MKSFTAVIHVMPHKVLLDPAGKTTLQAIKKLGFDNVFDTRIGKRIELSIQANDENEAHQATHQIANQLLINPIVEYFEIEVISS